MLSVIPEHGDYEGCLAFILLALMFCLIATRAAAAATKAAMVMTIAATNAAAANLARLIAVCIGLIVRLFPSR